MASSLETASAEASLAVVAAVVPQLESQIVAQENAIDLLIGRNPGPIARGAVLNDQYLPPEVPAGLPSELLERRPDLLRGRAAARRGQRQCRRRDGELLSDDQPDGRVRRGQHRSLGPLRGRKDLVDRRGPGGAALPGPATEEPVRCPSRAVGSGPGALREGGHQRLHRSLLRGRGAPEARRRREGARSRRRGLPPGRHSLQPALRLGLRGLSRRPSGRAAPLPRRERPGAAALYPPRQLRPALQGPGRRLEPLGPDLGASGLHDSRGERRLPGGSSLESPRGSRGLCPRPSRRVRAGRGRIAARLASPSTARSWPRGSARSSSSRGAPTRSTRGATTS